MKQTFLIFTLVLGSILLQPVNVQAQMVGNISEQPIWGPVGYEYVEYYYIPDIDVYYHVPKRQYIYYQGGRWLFSTTLPAQYRFDVFSGYKVVINQAKPYRYAQRYRLKYALFKGNRSQDIIRDSRDPKYFEIKDHPEHGKWKNNNQ